MACPRCQTETPPEAHFCHSCGADTQTTDGRRRAFAAKPDEPVATLALVSTIMPRGAVNRPRTYQYALAIAALATIITAAFGALPVAVLLAAFAIPLVYIVYLYDVNLWEDEPVLVTGLAFLLTLGLGALWTWLWLLWRGSMAPSSEVDGTVTFAAGGFLVAALLAPIVGEAIRNLGPILLARRPEFDDLMDGLTFGVISGVAFATADTLVKHWSLLTGGFVGTADGLTWTSLLLLEGFVKPLVMGTATGIACAEFSGLGKGFDGFTPRYFARFAEAAGVNVVYAAGSYLLAVYASPLWGIVLTALLGLALLACLIIRLRSALQVGLLEAALEASSKQDGATDVDMGFCNGCEMPLLPSAAFCSACGVSLRAGGRHASGIVTGGQR